jgi:hypothetical protein
MEQSIAPEPLTRASAITRIKTGLNSRSKTRWSVTGGRGTGWGWLHINARSKLAAMTQEEKQELQALLGLDRPVHSSVSVPASHDYWREYIDRAEGRTPSVIGRQYWD